MHDADRQKHDQSVQRELGADGRRHLEPYSESHRQREQGDLAHQPLGEPFGLSAVEED